MMFPGDSSQALRSGAYESSIPELQLMAGAAQSCETAPAGVNAHRACSTTAAVASLQNEPSVTGPATKNAVSEPAVTEENADNTPVEEIQSIQETTPVESPAVAPKKGKRLSPKVLRDKNR
jgi:septal ring-binding cell division protein DamX